MCMVAITFLNLIGIPIEIAFLDGQGGVGWEGFNVFSDTLFLIDVGLNFRMGIISEDNEVTKPLQYELTAKIWHVQIWHIGLFLVMML